MDISSFYIVSGEKDQKFKSGCDFVFFLYLFSQLRMFLQDVFTMFLGKSMGVVSASMTGGMRTIPIFSLRWWSQLWRSLLLFFDISRLFSEADLEG